MRGTARALTSRPIQLLGVAALLLALAAPAAADSPTERVWGPTLAVLDGAGAEAVLLGSAPAEGVSADGPSALGTVEADCCDGSTKTCEGSSGHFVDADCENGERGYCYTAEEGTKYCPDCSSPSCTENCSSDPYCQSKHGTSCSGFNFSTCQIWGSGGDCGNCTCDGSSWICTL